VRARFAMQRSRLAERVDRPDLRCCFIRRRGPGVGGPSQGCSATWQLSSRCTAQVLWALDVRTGAAVLPPAVIGGVGYSGGQAFTFTPNIQNNRLGLAFDGTNVRAPPTPAWRLLSMHPCTLMVQAILTVKQP